jgi:peptidoglycan/xylan/chitin deacetylase (PgdA/CDA1 family)
MNFKKLAEQKIDELSGKITPEQIMENAENDSVDLVLEGLDEIISENVTSNDSEEDSEEMLIELIPSEDTAENSVENSVEQMPRIKKDLFAGYLGELSEAPNPLEYGANATYRNLREGIVYKKGPDNLWEVFVKDGAPGRQGQAAPGGGCGVQEVKNIVENRITTQPIGETYLGSPSNPFPSNTERNAAYATALPHRGFVAYVIDPSSATGSTGYAFTGPTNTGWVSLASMEVLGGFATKALLDAAAATYGDGDCLYVTNDPTPAHNGIWRKNGAVGGGNWIQSSFDRVALVENSALSLDRRKADFAAGKNKFNPNDPDILVGKFLQDNTGGVGTSVNYTITGYIPVKPSTAYTFSSLYSMVWYDKDLNILQVVNASGIQKLQVSPAAAAFARVSVYYLSLPVFQMEESSTGVSSAYTPFVGIPDLFPKTAEIENKVNFSGVNLTLANAGELTLAGGTLIAGALGTNPAISLPIKQRLPSVVEFDFKFPSDPNAAADAYEVFALKLDGAADPYIRLSFAPSAPTIGTYVTVPTIQAVVDGLASQVFSPPMGPDAFSVRKATPVAADLSIAIEVTSDRVRIYNGATTIGEWLFSGYATLTLLTAAMRAALGADYVVKDYGIAGVVPSDLSAFTAHLCKSLAEVNATTGVPTGATIYDSYETFIPTKPTQWQRVRIEINLATQTNWWQLRNVRVRMNNSQIFNLTAATNLDTTVPGASITLNAGLSNVRNFRYIPEFVSPPRALVLMTHVFLDSPELPATGSVLQMSSGRLRRVIAAAKKYGWSFGTYDEFLAMQSGQIAPRDKMFIFTTDDSVFSWDTLPETSAIFQQNGIKNATAIITNNFDFSANSAALLRRRLDGNAVCSHASNHVNLPTLSYAQFVANMDLAKAQLVAGGHSVASIIYPGGSSSAEIRNWLANNGYRAGFTVPGGLAGGLAVYGVDVMHIPRVVFDDYVAFSSVDAVLNV